MRLVTTFSSRDFNSESNDFVHEEWVDTKTLFWTKWRISPREILYFLLKFIKFPENSGNFCNQSYFVCHHFILILRNFFPISWFSFRLLSPSLASWCRRWLICMDFMSENPQPYSLFKWYYFSSCMGIYFICLWIATFSILLVQLLRVVCRETDLLYFL